MISLLPRLFIELAPDRERQRLPLIQREDVPELRLANLLEVLIDPARQVGYFARLLRYHGFPLLPVLRPTILVCDCTPVYTTSALQNFRFRVLAQNTVAHRIRS